MFKKFQKLLVFGVTATMLAGALSGCGISGKKGSDDVIVWYMPKSIDNMSDKDLVMAEANKILDRKISFKTGFNFIANKLTIIIQRSITLSNRQFFFLLCRIIL